MEHARQFAENTSIHGVKHVVESRSLAERVGWAVLCLVAIGMVIVQTTAILIEYFSNTTKVAYEMSYDRREFPAVTVCNSNPFTATRMAYDVNFTSFWFLPPNLTEGSFYDDFQELDNQLEAAYSTGNVAEYIATLKELETLVVQQNISSREQQAYFMMELYGRDLNDTEMVGLSQPLNELVLSCEWQGKPCQMSKHFYAFFNPTYGNCFTFNSGLNPNASELETVEQVGEDFGLRLMLFVNQDEYIGPIAKSAGIRVAVHEARQYSWPLNEGFFISPQAETSVAISRKLVTRLESPYSDCVYEDVGKYSYLTYFPEYSYSMTACIETCSITKMVEQCGCVHYGSAYPSARKFHSVCLTLGKLECVKMVAAEALLSECNCHLPCKEMIYQRSVTHAHWPAVAYEATLKEELKQSFASNDYVLKSLSSGPCASSSYGGNVGSDLCKRNKTRDNPAWMSSFARLNVFFPTMGHEKVIMEPTYTEWSLLSEVGGTMGLYLGASLISLAEFMRFLASAVGLVVPKKPANETPVVLTQYKTGLEM